VGTESRGKNNPPLADYGFGFAVVNYPGSQQADPGVAMFRVIPGNEVLAKRAGILDAAKAFRKVRAILNRGMNSY